MCLFTDSHLLTELRQRIKMNVIDLALLCIAVIMMISGAKKGILVSLLGTVRFFVGIPLSFAVSDRYYRLIYDGYVRDVIYKSVIDKINSQANIEGYIAQLNEKLQSFPVVTKGNLDMSALSSFSNKDLAVYVTDTLLKPIAESVVKAAVFAVVLLVFYLLTGVIIGLIRKIRKSKKAPLRRTGGFLGGVFGLVKAAGLVFVLCTVFDLIVSTGVQGEFVKLLSESLAVEFVGKINPLL